MRLILQITLRQLEIHPNLQRRYCKEENYTAGNCGKYILKATD